ncbi:hypothetical protein HHI36_014636, partial [Cryptolaemus montrouzieri]
TISDINNYVDYRHTNRILICVQQVPDSLLFGNIIVFTHILNELHGSTRVQYGLTATIPKNIAYRLHTDVHVRHSLVKQQVDKDLA